MKKVVFALLTSIVVPTLYNTRKYYLYNKMVNKYEKDNINNRQSWFMKIFNYV